MGTSPLDPAPRPPEPDPPLPELLDGRYRTGRVLGRGGMARVYLAHDLKHGRDVALKVIRPELSRSLAHERFLREIEIAARLRHPNIVPLYDSGQVDGSLYFVMPYEEGPSLRDRLRTGGPLPMADALGALRDVARALAYAHEHGVVHRDIKSDNVMLSGGAAVVTDFGIAKAVSAALHGGVDATLTQTGSAIGTPAYMSPEQATGDPATDHRTDIYAFGCLAYEAISGHPPFHTLAKHQLVTAHLTAIPPRLDTAAPGVPEPVVVLVARCLEKDPAARPQTAREVLAALDRVGPGSGAATERAAARPAASVGPALRRVIPMLVGAILVAGAFAVIRDSGSAQPLRVSVLPFGNSAADTALDGVTDGLADEVASMLTRVPGIQIMSRSSARTYRGQHGVDVTEAGAKLKADYLVTAVMRRDRANWIVSAEFARAADAASLWTRTFTLNPEQAAANAQLIADTLVAALRARFSQVGAVPVVPAATQQPSSSEAYWLWVRGQEKLARRGSSVSESAELFRQAIQNDSLYARAWSGLAMALVLFPYFERARVAQIRDEVESAARRALALDPGLAQAHVALGMLYQFDYRWDDAASAYATAVRLDPQDVEARLQHARHLLFRGRTAAAFRELEVARTEDPASATILAWIAYAYYLDGRVDSALTEARRAVASDPTGQTAVATAAMIQIWSGRPDEARALLGANPVGMLHIYLAGRVGDTAAARALLREFNAGPRDPTTVETDRAFAYLGLGDTASALSALERATDAGEIWGVMQPTAAPFFDPVRGSERFNALLRRIRLAN
jgi:serine/threonine-protein kinase